jgi:hypothetical protein
VFDVAGKRAVRSLTDPLDLLLRVTTGGVFSEGNGLPPWASAGMGMLGIVSAHGNTLQSHTAPIPRWGARKEVVVGWTS